jgi:hypothetical protein
MLQKTKLENFDIADTAILVANVWIEGALYYGDACECCIDY